MTLASGAWRRGGGENLGVAAERRRGRGVVSAKAAARGENLGSVAWRMSAIVNSVKSGGAEESVTGGGVSHGGSVVA
jgi:hypothetical protein